MFCSYGFFYSILDSGNLLCLAFSNLDILLAIQTIDRKTTASDERVSYRYLKYKINKRKPIFLTQNGCFDSTSDSKCSAPRALSLAMRCIDE